MEYWIDIEDASENRYGAGPISSATVWEHTPELDAAGRFAFSMPAGEPIAAEVQNRRIVRCWGMIDGTAVELGTGIIDRVERDADQGLLRVSGRDILAELAACSVEELRICERTYITLDDPLHGYIAQVDVDYSGAATATALANVHDADFGTYAAVTIAKEASWVPLWAKYLYVGADVLFYGIRITFKSVSGTAYTCILYPQYFDGTDWVEQPSFTDGTKVGNITWKQNGEITWEAQSDWARYKTVWGGDWYWMRFSLESNAGDPYYASTSGAEIYEIEVLCDIPSADGVNKIMAYAPDTWTRTGYPETVNAQYLEFRGESVLEALVTLAEQGGVDGTTAVREHFRLGSGREIDWLGDTVTASGVTAVEAPAGPIAAEGVPELVQIRSLRQTIESSEVVTQIHPLSADGLSIGQATVSAPDGYSHDLATTYPWVRHTAGYAAYGKLERWVEFSELSLQQANSYNMHPIDLANQLHQRAVEWLRTHAAPAYEYALSILQFPALLKPGDSIDCVYQRYRDGEPTIDIDTIRDGTPLHILAPTLQVTTDGVATIALKVATIDRALATDARVIVEAIRAGRRSGAAAANIATMATGTPQPPTAGVDMSVDGYEVSRAGNRVLLLPGDGGLASEYAYTEAGVTAALAAAAAGDVVDLPAGTLTGNITVPAGVTLRGRGASTVIDGAVTLKGRLAACRITRVANSATALTGIVSGVAGDVGIVDYDVIVDVQNSGGPAYAVYMATGGDITVHEGDLLATVGTDGYAAYVTSGPFRHERGRAVGTTALTPYWMET